jgi:beta-lactamase regulating signal transducer with metallopeptidase domain
MSVLVRHYGLGLFIEKPIVLPSVELEIPADTPEIVFSTEIQPATLEVPTGITIAEKSSWDLKIPWRIVALYGWMVAALIMLGRLIIAFVSGIRLLHRARSNRCEHIRSAADSARARLGITKGLKIRSSKNVRSPIIWCWNRPPVLLVPADLDDRIDWVDVICHELAHWRRWDHISGLIAELAVCILPWNPLLWWSKKRMLRLSEQACDDWVLAGGCAGTDYAQSLLNLSPELQMAFMPTVIGKEKPMKKRIYRIVKEKCGIPQVGARWAFAVTMIAASVTVGVALAQRRPARFEPPERDERIAAEQRERQVLAEHRANLENRAQELKARLDRVRMELAELEESGKGESERARALRVELREMEEAMAHLERELNGLEGERRDREIRPWPNREPPREILRRLEELSRETEFLLQGLADQRIGRNDETNMLYNRMRELNEQMRQVRQQLGRQLEDPDRRIREPGELEREELKEKARQIELELKELGVEKPERAEKLHTELRAIHEAIAQIEYDAILLRYRNMHQVSGLQIRARELERRLQELGDSHPEEAQELRMQLDQIQQQIQMSRHEDDRLPRLWPHDEDPKRPGNEFHRQELMVRREQLHAQMREIELILGELNEQGKAESEDARMHNRELHQIHKLLQATENELRKSEPGRAQEHERDDLEREVQYLRKQMDSVNEQMGEMRELMKRLLQKNETPEDL